MSTFGYPELEAFFLLFIGEILETVTFSFCSIQYLSEVYFKCREIGIKRIEFQVHLVLRSAAILAAVSCILARSLVCFLSSALAADGVAASKSSLVNFTI